MDLTERGDSRARYPWEVQRFEAYRRVLADHEALGARKVLDVGAGDAWFAARLLPHLPPDAEVTCWDVNYRDDDVGDAEPGINRTRDEPTDRPDLVLALDVLEHIEDPVAFLATTISPLTRPGTPALIAVPAYQWLFSRHDEALGHHRRYGRRALLDLVCPWLDVVEHGSLFTCLLLPRAAAVAVERLRPPTSDQHGIGDWSGGRALTAVTNGVLAGDARVGRLAARAGVRLPGLSHWAFGVTR